MSTSKDTTTYDKSTLKTEASDVVFAEKDRNKLFLDALEERRFITGQETTRFGMTADFSHLEFMMAVGEHSRPIISHMKVNHAQGLYAFWLELCQYLKPLLKKYRVLSESYTSLIEDESEMLTTLARQKIKLDLTEDYFVKKASEMERRRYGHFMRVETKKIDEKVRKIAESEKERLKAEEAIKAEAKEKFGKKVEK